MKANSKRLYAVICESCGERYSLRTFSKKNPLEVCGECGCEYFIPYSRNCLIGFKTLEHYIGALDLLPERLLPVFISEFGPRLSPFRKTS
jgi:hypothetical protein